MEGLDDEGSVLSGGGGGWAGGGKERKREGGGWARGRERASHATACMETQTQAICCTLPVWKPRPRQTRWTGAGTDAVETPSSSAGTEGQKQTRRDPATAEPETTRRPEFDGGGSFADLPISFTFYDETRPSDWGSKYGARNDPIRHRRDGDGSTIRHVTCGLSLGLGVDDSELGARRSPKALFRLADPVEAVT